MRINNAGFGGVSSLLELSYIFDDLLYYNIDEDKENVLYILKCFD